MGEWGLHRFRMEASPLTDQPMIREWGLSTYPVTSPGTGRSQLLNEITNGHHKGP